MPAEELYNWIVDEVELNTCVITNSNFNVTNSVCPEAFKPCSSYFCVPSDELCPLNAVSMNDTVSITPSYPYNTTANGVLTFFSDSSSASFLPIIGLQTSNGEAPCY